MRHVSRAGSGPAHNSVAGTFYQHDVAEGGNGAAEIEGRETLGHGLDAEQGYPRLNCLKQLIFLSKYTL
jgi:hypothetical protein